MEKIKEASLNWGNVQSTNIYVFLLKWIEINVKGLLNWNDGGMEITGDEWLRDNTL